MKSAALCFLSRSPARCAPVTGRPELSLVQLTAGPGGSAYVGTSARSPSCQFSRGHCVRHAPTHGVKACRALGAAVIRSRDRQFGPSPATLGQAGQHSVGQAGQHSVDRATAALCGRDAPFGVLFETVLRSRGAEQWKEGA